jgi:glycosyltransferase involved in cell wall biosynthesis
VLQPERTIYVNGRFLTQTLSGMQRFAEELLTAWDGLRVREAQPCPVEVLAPDGECRKPAWKTLHVRQIPGAHGHIWEQTILFLAARSGVLVNLLGSGPLLHPRQAVTLHDASAYDFPQLYTWRFRLFHKTLQEILSRRAWQIFTVSEFSRRRLANALGIQSEKISVIPNGCDHLLGMRADHGVLVRYGLSPKRFILCVGNDTPNKNIGAVIRAFTLLKTPNIQLAHAGTSDDRIFRKAADRNARNIVRLGYVSDAELRALYENALAFVFPSRYEGFGIPPLEAMSLGCPVVSSRGGSLPESLGDAALFVDPDDTEAFAGALRWVIADEVLRHKLIAVGRARAAQFTWSAAAERLGHVLRDMGSPRNGLRERPA